jgi:hypothetical protein
MPENQPIDYSQPVAYDKDGRPLYAHPPAQQLTTDQSSHVTAAPVSQPGHNFDPRTRVQYSNEPGVRHVAREIDPPKLPVNEDSQLRHEDSKQRYPFLNLSEGEFVILAVQRHPIGLLIPIAATVIGILVVYILAFMFIGTLQNGGVALPNTPSGSDIILFASLVALLLGIFGYIYVWVYLQNKFFMTNESVIQEIQHSPFAKHEQTVSLGSIEDASFKQRNILETVLNYGTIRLSTEGEETTYRFHYVSNPKKQIARLNNAVESFKNGRPVLADD